MVIIPSVGAGAKSRFTDALLNDSTYSGFPVLDGGSGKLLGYASRYKLRHAIGMVLVNESLGCV